MEGVYDAFLLRFMECKKKVIQAFLELHLGSIIAIKPEQQEEGKEEEGEVEDAEEVTKGATNAGVKEASIQETIARAMVKAEAMIDMAMKAFEMGLTPPADPEK